MLQLIGELGIPLLLGVAYVWQVRRLEPKGRAPSVKRQLCFAAGLLTIAATTAGPLGSLSEERVSAHMVQHLLLMDLAGFLLVMGVTGPVLQPILGAPVLRHLRPLFHPAVALAIFIGAFAIWHIPALYQAAAQNNAVHAVEHGLFLSTGVIKWMALIGPLPAPLWFATGIQIVYVAAEHMFVAVVGNVFMWAGTPIYPLYAERTAALGIDPVTDQSIGGGFMAVWGMLLTLGLLAWVLLRWSKHDTERQELVEFAHQHGLVIDEDRIKRAVLAGHGETLRRRLREQAESAAPGEPAATSASSPGLVRPSGQSA
ncbi:cytochrome c oxidase assembly protein [Thermoleophilia bacterium SCSIO 60948]|nr:cytochrome c oxidase assembly protein [Thermoleophilia bacterium SCSIO 60948]